MKFDVLTIGGAVFDLFVRPEKESILRIDNKRGSQTFLAFPHGHKLEIDDVHMEFGGGASNVAVNLSFMKLKTAVLARIGGDYYGKEILKNLKKYKIAVDGVEVVKAKKSGFSIIVNSYDGERTVLYSRGANNESPVMHMSLLGAARCVHITSLPDDCSRIFEAIIAEKKKRKDFLISWNPGAHQLKKGYRFFSKFLKHVDVLFLNREELELFSGLASKRYDKKTQQTIMTECHEHLVSSGDDFLSYVYDVREPVKKLMLAGLKQVIITDGRRGAQYFGAKEHYYVPCGETKPVATLGAGDAFCSGFIAGMLYHHDDSKVALQYATLNAGSVVTQFGAQKGILTKVALEKGLGTFPILSLH